MYLLYRSRHVVSWLPAIVVAGCLLFVSQQAVLQVKPHYDDTVMELSLAEPEPPQPEPVPEPQPEIPPQIQPEPEPEAVAEPVVSAPEPIIQAKPVVKPKAKPRPKPVVKEKAPKPQAIAAPQPAAVRSPVSKPAPPPSPRRRRRTRRRWKTAICRRCAGSWSSASATRAAVRLRWNVRRATWRSGWRLTAAAECWLPVLPAGRRTCCSIALRLVPCKASAS